MNSKKVLIAPSILSADFSRLEKEISEVEKAGADWIHVDVMDGHFVPNLTIGPVVVHWLRKTTQLPLDVHLMITEPGKYIPQFAKAGADSITFHIEACPEPAKLIQEIKNLNKRVGMSVRPATPLSAIVPYLKDLDVVLIMTVEPGFGSQKFMPDVLPKVHELRKLVLKDNLKLKIEVDGGISSENANLVVQNGGEVLVAGSAVFGQKDRSNAINQLKDSIKS